MIFSLWGWGVDLRGLGEDGDKACGYGARDREDLSVAGWTRGQDCLLTSLSKSRVRFLCTEQKVLVGSYVSDAVGTKLCEGGWPEYISGLLYLLILFVNCIGCRICISA